MHQIVLYWQLNAVFTYNEFSQKNTVYCIEYLSGSHLRGSLSQEEKNAVK